eukprot:602665-Pelagomonas_calceolata.AAC.1
MPCQCAALATPSVTPFMTMNHALTPVACASLLHSNQLAVCHLHTPTPLEGLQRQCLRMPGWHPCGNPTEGHKHSH